MKKQATLLAFLLAACSSDQSNPTTSDSPTPDAATDAGSEGDSADTGMPDDGADAGSDCVQAGVVPDSLRVEYADDVAIEYSADLDTDIKGERRPIRLLFERYNDTTYVGTFELGTGADDNFGTCAHCVYVPGGGPERAYFADRGSLTLNRNPYSRRMDASVSDLRVIEVAVDPFTRESAPIADGVCVEIADFDGAGTFPVGGWLCDDEQFADGTACHCNCGAIDPDCGGAIECLLGDPSCEPREELPVEGCTPEQVCAYSPLGNANVCTESCDWLGGDACSAGTCVFDFGVGDGDLCVADGPRVADIAIGEACDGGGLQQVCAVADGFARGFCGPNDVCRPICQSDAECTVADETCRTFLFDGELGYCGPEPVDG